MIRDFFLLFQSNFSSHIQWEYPLYRESSSLDLDDIYELGINGLMELIQQDERFNAFEASLFSPQARRTDREGQTVEENKKINAAIAELLLLLSPHFMEKAAHKVIEWLLRRFQIHRFNMFDVVACSIAFHETNAWARLVQLLPVRESAFSFLEGVHRTGSPMPRQVLIERCVTPGGIDLLDFLYQVMAKSAKRGIANRPLCSLWGSLAVGAVRFRPLESTTQSVLPLALSALRHTPPDAQVSSCGMMAVAQLSRSVTLAPAAVRSICATVSALAVQEDQGALLTLCAVCQWQTHVRSLEAGVAAALLEKAALVSEAHSNNVDTRPLVACVLQSVVENVIAGKDTLLVAWEGAAPSWKRQLDVIGEEAVSHSLFLLAETETSVSDRVIARLARLWKPLGAVVGEGIARALQQCGNNSGGATARIEQLASSILGPVVTSYSPLPGKGTTLLMSLSNKRADVRLAGLQAIDREVKAKRISCNHELATTAAMLLIQDTDETIALAALRCGWIGDALAAGDQLWDALKPCLHVTNSPTRIQAALPWAFTLLLEEEHQQQRVDEVIASLLRLVIVAGRVQTFVLDACQEALHEKRQHPIFLALAQVGRDEHGEEGEEGGEAAEDKSSKKSSNKEPRTSNNNKVARRLLHSVVGALGEQCESNFDRCWPLLSGAHFDSEARVSLCCVLLRAQVDPAQQVTLHALSLLDQPFEGSLWTRRAQLCSLLAKHGSISMVSDIFAKSVHVLRLGGGDGDDDEQEEMAVGDGDEDAKKNKKKMKKKNKKKQKDDEEQQTEEKRKKRKKKRKQKEEDDDDDGDDNDNDDGDQDHEERRREKELIPKKRIQLLNCVKTLLERAGSPWRVLSSIWSDLSHQEAALNALYFGEAFIESNVAPADAGAWMLASLFVPLQAGHNLVRKAATRCVVKLAQSTQRCALPVEAMASITDAASLGEIEQSSEGLAGVLAELQGNGASGFIAWMSKQLDALEQFDSPVNLALLKASRLVNHVARVPALWPRLGVALASPQYAAHATLILQSFGTRQCSAALAEALLKKDSHELLVQAIGHENDSVSRAALQCVTSQVWELLHDVQQRAIFGALCGVVSSSSASTERIAEAMRLTKNVGVVRGNALLSAQLTFNAAGAAATAATTDRGGKKAKTMHRDGASTTTMASLPTHVVAAELARLEVVLELVRASNSGDAGTAMALISLLETLAPLADTHAAADATIQLAAMALSNLLNDGRVLLKEEQMQPILLLLSGRGAQAPALRKTLLSVVATVAEHSPQIIATQLIPLLTSASASRDDRGSFVVLRHIVDNVFPHVPEAQVEPLLHELLRRLPETAAHRRAVLLLSAAQGLPTRPAPAILGHVLLEMGVDEGRELATSLCSDLGAVTTLQALLTLVETHADSVVLARFVCDSLTAQWFLNAMLTLSPEEEEVAQELLASFFELLLKSVSTQMNRDAKDAMLEAIAAVNELFTIPRFLTVVKRLLRPSAAAPSSEARRRVLMVFNERTQNHRPYLKAKEEKRFVKMFPRLQRVISDAQCDDALLQVAFISLEVLGRAFGAQHPDPALAALGTVISVASTQRVATDDVVRATALLTMATLCASVGPPCVAQLGSVLGLCCGAVSSGSADLAYAGLSAILLLADSLGKFFSSHAEHVLTAVLGASTLAQPLLAGRVRLICEALAHSLAPRLLAAAVQQIVARDLGPGVLLAAKTVALASEETSRPAELRQLWNACSVALYREPALDEEAVGAAADAMAEVAFRLSEAEFRPLLSALLESATNNNNSNGNEEHLGAVFRVFFALLRKLKSLAIPWVTRLATVIVDALAKRKNGRLVRGTLAMLQAMFAADVDSTIDKDVHAQLLDGIVPCLEVDSSLQAATDCLLEQAASMNNDALWRPLNHAILLRLRSNNVNVRVGCMRLVVQLWQRMHESWLVMLPETMPFLGEVLEDDNAQVVKEAQRLKKYIGSLLPPDEGLDFE